MKIVALDLGDAWVGTAISDPLGIVCTPLQTVALESIQSFLETLIKQEDITTIIVGLPMTMTGTVSAQTTRIISQKDALEIHFATQFPGKLAWILWDERLSSKFATKAAHNKRPADKAAKLRQHSVAAAFILQSYLDHLVFKRSLLED